MIKLLILDVDGVLTDGRKTYNDNGLGCYKVFCDKDFTAIKRLKSSGVRVCFLSGDENVNRAVANNRDIDFYFSRGKCKTEFLSILSEKYSCPTSKMAFVGDDLFDLHIAQSVGYSFCPSDSCSEIKKECTLILKSKGGDNVVMELVDYLIDFNLIPTVEPKEVLESIYKLDEKEKF